MKNLEVIGLGALNVDHLYRVERILEDGESVVREAEVLPGGSAANTIYGLGKLGVATGFAGVVGDDAEGNLLLADFETVGVDTSRIKVKPEAKTGSVIGLSDSAGHRSLYVLPGANSWLTMADLDPDYLNSAEMLHLTSFAGEAQFRLSLELVNKLESSVRLSFSPGALYAAKGLAALSPLLRRTGVLFINQDEMRQLTGSDFIAGAAECLKQGCRIVAVTLGKGASVRTATATGYISDGQNSCIIEPTPQERASVMDTTGAGDAFATGFLYGLLRGKGLEECGRLGDAAARFSITKVGAREGLPTIDELTRQQKN